MNFVQYINQIINTQIKLWIFHPLKKNPLMTVYIWRLVILAYALLYTYELIWPILQINRNYFFNIMMYLVILTCRNSLFWKWILLYCIEFINSYDNLPSHSGLGCTLYKYLLSGLAKLWLTAQSVVCLVECPCVFENKVCSPVIRWTILHC